VTGPVQRTRETYDLVAADYAVQSRSPSAAFRAHRDAFAASVRGRVVDLGCGPGHDLEAFRTGGLDAVGVDLSSSMLGLARSHGPVVQGDLRRPPLRDRAWDGLWSSASLLHVPQEDVPATLRCWHRLLRPGGRLGLTTSLGGQEGWERVPYATPQPVPGELSRWYVHHDRQHLIELLAQAGFHVERSHVHEAKRTWLQLHATA
jgi:SAM-dependent methyltransferase